MSISSNLLTSSRIVSCWRKYVKIPGLDSKRFARGKPRDLEEFAFLCVRSEELGDPRMPPRDIHDG